MINKKNFEKKLSITQGRHLEIINNKIQLFPDKSWKNELKLFKLTQLKFIEWVISFENFHKNPICKKNGHILIKKYLQKNSIKCRSIDLDFIVKENPLNYIDRKLIKFYNKISTIALNSKKIGVKYLIFPFLENSSPNTDLKLVKLLEIFKQVQKEIPKKMFILIETDLDPKKLLTLIKKMQNKIFINYDLGNSASKNYDFLLEKKYFKYVKNIHLKDRRKNGPTVRFGKGNADFKKMFNFLSKNKYKYDFTMQPARSKTNQDIKEIKLNLKYIKKLLSNL